MHPASSVIIFTTLSGMGFGLIAWLGLGFLAQTTAFLPSAIIALFLTVAGLLASTFHLGNPQRAWRALSQWRSSWLSREGVLSIVTLILFSGYSAMTVFWNESSPVLGLLAAAAAVATVVATAMIYAQMKTVPRWNHAFTPACYILFAAAGGALWLCLVQAASGTDGAFRVLSLVALVAAWVAKFASWTRMEKATLAAAGSTPESATGLGPMGKVSLLEPPHTSPNYLMKEMVFRIGRKHARKLRLIAILLGAALPLACLLLYGLAANSMLLPAVAVLSHMAGVFVERWLFFAEAEHVVSLYYGQR